MSSAIIAVLLLTSCAATRREVAAPVPEPHSFEADYYYMRGYGAFISGDYAMTLTFFKKALEYDPGSAYLRLQIGHLLFRKGDVDGALSIAEAVVKEHPEDVKGLMLLSEIYNSRKRVKETVDLLGRIRKLAGDDSQVWMFLGKVYYSNEMADEAIDAFQKVLQADPEEFVALDYLASISIDRKDYAKAEEYLQRELDLRPLESVYFKLGVVAEMQDKYAAAIGDYEKVLQMNPLNMQARERLAQLYVRQKEIGSAINEFLVLSRQQPDNTDMHVRLGMLYFESKEYGKSLDEFRMAVASRPDDTSIHYYLALVLEEMDRLDEAVTEFRWIIGREPKNINAFLHLAIIYSKQKKEDQAIRMFEEILGFDPDKPEIYISLAISYSRQKEFDKAEKTLRDAIARFSDDKDREELYFNLAMVYDKAGRYDDMISSLRTTIKINPKNADALNYLGYYFADKNINIQEAKDLLERALEVKPDNGYIIDSYGWVLYRMGSFEQAITQLQKALTLTPDDPLLFEHLGDAYHAVRNESKAREYWSRSLEHPEKEEGLRERVEKKLQELKARGQ